MRPLSLLVLITSAGIALARSRLNGDAEEPKATPCTVKAWVRAEDMKPNTVSHGELKVKVIQPCTDRVEAVSIRLRLDEMSEMSTIANTTSDGDFWDFSGATPSQEWTTTKHKRSAFKVEKTLSADVSLKSENWGKGVVFPFTVISPNVNYPPAIFPLMFNGQNTATQRSSFGRLYRYIASIKLVSESGIPRMADVAAGFTAYLPREPTLMPEDTLPYRTRVTAVERDRRWTMQCEEDSAPKSTDTDTPPATLNLTVTLPEGHTLIQGKSFVVDAKLDHANAAANRYSFSIQLIRNITIKGAPALDIDGDELYHSQFWFQEIFGDMSTMDSHPMDISVGLAHSLRSHVARTFPRTSTGTSGASPFEIHSILSLTLDETMDVAKLDPTPTYTRRAWRSGEKKSAKLTETGWEFSECDRHQYHRRTYRVEIPVTVVGAPSGFEFALSEPPIDYLANDGHVPVPRILSGHVSTSPQHDFDTTEPVIVRDTGRSTLASSGEYSDFGNSEAIDAKAGHYVGALWHRKVHGVDKSKLGHLGAGSGLSENQAVLSHPVHEL